MANNKGLLSMNGKQFDIPITINHKEAIAELRLTTSPERKCKITVDIEGHHYGEFSATDYFACLDAIRNQLTDVIFHCHGARIDTYPSGMSRDMGSGMAVYCMKMGKQALQEDLVGTFNDYRNETLVTPSEQREFFLLWLESLR